MRKLTDPYDPMLNKPSVNQDQVAKAVWEAAGAVKEAGADGKLEALEILNIAIGNAPEAFRTIVLMLNDDIPLGEDVVNIGWVFQNQLKPFRQPTIVAATGSAAGSSSAGG